MSVAPSVASALHEISDPIERQSALSRRAAELRAHYGKLGMIVYDRLDRWRDEHSLCAPSAHEPGVERMIYVVHCKDTDAVAVCESWQFARP